LSAQEAAAELAAARLAGPPARAVLEAAAANQAAEPERVLVNRLKGAQAPERAAAAVESQRFRHPRHRRRSATG
jgi:hypothetical protein